MKTLFHTIFMLSMFVATSSCHQSQESNLSTANNSKEEFMEFLERYSQNDEFQLSRTKFPLLYVSWDETFTKLDTSYTEKSNWKIRHFNFEPDRQSYSQVYDNFEHKLRDTDERVFAWHGIGNGIRIFLYFRRIEGCWYLIKEEYLST
jgi:hypothetical protein